MSEKLTRRKLESLPRQSIHEARNWSKADVSLAEWPSGSNRRVVIKDLRRRPLWFRVLAGRALLRREWRALCALKDVEGVPAPVARPDADCIVMGYCAGTPIENLPALEVPEGAVTRLEELLAQMHRRGVTHGDLHGYNILVDESGGVSLIDWATACVFGSQGFGAKKWTFEEWKALDERAFAKIKLTHDPVGITSRQRDLIVHGGSRVYRAIKKFKALRETLRGPNEARDAAREAKQNQYLSRLDEYYRAGAEGEEAISEKSISPLGAITK
jgi:hypothetical protein